MIQRSQQEFMVRDNQGLQLSLQGLIWVLVIAGLLTLTRGSMAQSPQPHEPLPRTFEGVHQLIMPSVELQSIRLLMMPDEVKAILEKAGLQFEETKGTLAARHYSSLHIRQPQKGFQIFSFGFQEGKLQSVLIEYDLNYVSFDFPAYLAELKTKHGEPVEVKDVMKQGKAPAPLHTFDAYDYRWVDDQTELQIHYGTVGEDPILHRPHAGTLVWVVSDKRLAEKTREENAQRFKRKEFTEEERKQALKELLESVEKNRQEIERQK